jgi:hypothetical protein
MKQNQVLCCVNMAFTKYADGVVKVEIHRDETTGKVLASEMKELIRWLTADSTAQRDCKPSDGA